MYSFDIIGDIENYWGIDFSLIDSHLQRANGDDVTIKMHSGGGSVIEGFAIRNELKSYSGNITINIVGMAASIASVILTGANKVTMQKGSFVMIHEATFWSMEPLTAEEMQQQGKTLEFFEGEIVEAYLDAINKRKPIEDRKKKKKYLEDLMKAETWLGAEAALELGLIDEITEEEVKKELYSNRFLNKSNYRNMPKELETQDFTEKDMNVLAKFFNYATSFFNKQHGEELPAAEAEPEAPQIEKKMNLEEAKAALEQAGYNVTKVEKTPAVPPAPAVEEATTVDPLQELTNSFEEKLSNLQNTIKELQKAAIKPLPDTVVENKSTDSPLQRVIENNLKIGK